MSDASGSCDREGAALEPVLIGSMTLYPVPESVIRARRWFRKFIERHGLDCVDDWVLMVSELVTNAILHGEAQESWRVRVEWWRVGEALRVDVHNSGLPGRVRMRQAAADEVHGRGLHLVDALSDSWCAGRASSEARWSRSWWMTRGGLDPKPPQRVEAVELGMRISRTSRTPPRIPYFGR